MYPIQTFSKLFGLEHDNPGLFVAQYKAIAQQMPLLYLLIISSTLAVSNANLYHAPVVLSVVFPAALLLGCIAFFYWFMAIPESVEPEELNRRILIRLHATIWNNLVFAALFSSWSMQLFLTGDIATQGLVVAFVGVSTFGIILCLMHVRAAVVAYLGASLIPLFLFMWATGESHFRTGAFVIFMVALVFIIV
ncbi:MAG TPA: hypothetical protein ENK61_03695, partial [Devosia sp.]|nr:hypothetical protein [Devosia sp.]